MPLALDEDQTLLAETAAELVRERCSLAAVRRLRDSRDPVGFSVETWKKMADLGWTAIPFPESQGGLGLGLVEIAIVSEALGRALAPEPLVSTILLAGGCLSLGGTDVHRADWLAGAIAGTKILALAFQEQGSRYDLCRVATRAERAPGGFEISGEKIQVLDGHAADAILVVARTSGREADRDGVSLFLLPRGAEGVEIARQFRVDSRAAAIVRLAGARVPEAAVVGGVGRGLELLETVVDRATVALSAEMLGGMSEAFARTLSYMKEREQFGVKIGTFQALQHRAARLFIEIELARSAVFAAARAADEASVDAGRLASLAKARCSDAFLLVANEAIQIHGGIGMTDEHDIGFFLKRARAAEMTFGDAAFHRDRFATLSGF